MKSIQDGNVSTLASAADTRSVRGRWLAPWVAAALAGLLVTLVGCGSGSSTTEKTTAAKASTGAGTAASSATGSSANGPSTASQSSAAPDACRLVTPAEAQAALGKTVRPAKAKLLGPTGQGASCTYESTDFANGTAAGRALTITYFPHSSMTKAQFDKNYSSNGSRAVAGLGDGAWYLGGILNVYDHGANLSVAIVSLTTESTVDQLEPVTRLALGRI